MPVHVRSGVTVCTLLVGICVAYANMLVSKVPCGPNAKPHGTNASLNASQWNIVHVGYTRVRIMLAMSISSCLYTFSSRWVANDNVWDMGLSVLEMAINNRITDIIIISMGLGTNII